mmetsp:Transcript_19919/g.25661  ORF Transcript_19919/g.25661 Transcript_19919/m.25661 type:complete len:288 (-) Transcript_19919:59-922(-)
MASAFVIRHLSLDSVGVAITLTGCLALLADANRQGQAPLKGSIPAKEGRVSPNTFPPQQCRQLERDGFIVVDNFLTPQQVQAARQAIEVLDDNRKFRASPYEEDDVDSSSRTRDRVLVNRSGELDLVRQAIAGIAKSLADSDFKGFVPADNYKDNTLFMPAQMQVSICGGKEDKPSTHNFYHKHVDNAEANHLGELGLLGWLRSQHLRKRYLTCIVYLNPEWKEGDGGCLRVFKASEGVGDGSDAPYLDVAPLAGRVVIFSSTYQVHSVLATNVQRYACAVWLALGD